MSESMWDRVEDYACQPYATVTRYCDEMDAPRWAVYQLAGQIGFQWPAWQLRARRMQRARRLLATTDWPLHVIAWCVGYTNVPAFVRRFRIWHGCPPGRWRRQQAAAVAAVKNMPFVGST